MDACRIKLVSVLFALLTVSALMTATAAELPVGQLSSAPAQVPYSNRKLLQWNSRRYDRRYSGDAQLARNNAAIVNSQYAIRAAVESGANPAVTQGAAYYANNQAWQAANNPYYPYGGRWGGRWGRH